MKKRIFCLCIACMLVFGTAFAVPGTKLGFEALDMLYKQGENCVISPVSLAYALAMAAQGAGGETQSELLALLDVQEAAQVAEMQKSLTQSGLRLANAAFLTGDLIPKAEYTEELRTAFGAEWFENEGDMVGRINAWVQDHTDGMIDKLLNGPLSEDAALVLANAVAMDAKWSVPFRAENTSKGTFHAAGRDVTVDFMRQKAWFGYGERDGVQLLCKSYAGTEEDSSRLSMFIALPEAGGIPRVLKELQAEGLDYFAFEEYAREVRLVMPKMDISDDNSLAGVLTALGMETAFTPAADFSGISDMPMRVGDVLQKARVQVDEEGTKAAAATAVTMLDGAAMLREEPVEMILDRPFVFLIVDEGSGGICFAGVVEDPSYN